MKRLFGLIFSLIVMAGGARFASAQDMPPQGPPPGGGGGMRMQFQMPSFAEMDKNKDKKLSRDEMPAQFPAQAFDRVDTNKDGFVDEEEWNAMRSRFGGPGGGGRFGESLTKYLDANHDGKVSRDEFAKMISLFDTLDQDHNGDLSQEELNGFFRAVNEAQTQATGGVDAGSLFTKYDKNKDGKITPDEMTEERTFKALDLNKDASVTREEAEQALKQIAERAKQKKQAQPQPPNQ
ncbi:MAG TPA: EF-hand domain-containing protein [Blastocatellia bacterium]|nr:EF-hand domain-containing protein [Blastocatellia bacterium]